MLLVVSALRNYAVEASDGAIGRVSDFLFDDESWKVRWVVVDTGGWLGGRKVLIHPSAVGTPDYERELVPVRLTTSQVKGSPDIQQDRPVSRQMENTLHSYYGWDPLWGGASYFGGGAMASPLAAPPFFGLAGPADTATLERRPDDGDPHLRSVSEIIGYHIRATDGQVGHVENFLVDEASWAVRYLIIDTRNWWPGKHVLISPYAIQEIDWSGHEARVAITGEQVKSSPPWDPAEIIDEAYEHRLHSHYGWPGYGW